RTSRNRPPLLASPAGPRCRSRAFSRARSRGDPAPRRRGSRACRRSRIGWGGFLFPPGASRRPRPSASGRCSRCRPPEPSFRGELHAEHALPELGQLIARLGGLLELEVPGEVEHLLLERLDLAREL